MLNFEQSFVLIVILFLVVTLYKGYLQPITSFFISTVFFGSFNIISSNDILSGFANEQIIVILLLILVGNIIQKASIVEIFFNLLFRNAKSYKSFLARLMIYIAGASSIFNNTPLVAIMMPYIKQWTKRNSISASKLLIPLSYAAILGGSATLIGTSTNLIINGMYIDAGYESLNIFDFSYVGIPMIMVGFLYMFFIGNRLLPSNKGALNELKENTREYLIEAIINKNSELDGKTIQEANLRNLDGLYLIEIIRNNEKIQAAPITMLKTNDKLIFVGDTSKILDLIQNYKGIELPTTQDFLSQSKSDIIEVVISPNSALINRKIRTIKFREIYNAAIVAVHRNGSKLIGKVGDTILKAGDVLLLIQNKEIKVNKDFYQISLVTKLKKLTHWERFVLLGGLIAIILLAAFKVITLFKGLLILLAIIIIFRIAKFAELKQSFDFKLLAIAGMALGIGKALINSGLADLAANSLINVLQPFGTISILIGIFIITNIIASYMTNITAVSIMFPISLAVGNELVITSTIESITPFVLVVAYASSANYITPVGYLTNIMVYGSGAYTFKDFFKVGFPLAILHFFVTISILSFIYNL